MGKVKSNFGSKKGSDKGESVKSTKKWGVQPNPFTWVVIDESGGEHSFDKLWDAQGFYWDRLDMRAAVIPEPSVPHVFVSKPF